MEFVKYFATSDDFLDCDKPEKSGTIKDGLYKEYFNNGKIKVLGHFKNGEKNGLWKYYVNTDCYLPEKVSELSQKGHYKFGKKEGVWETYDLYGAVQLTETYENGKRNGLYKGYDGESEYDGMYRNGKRIGHWTEYYAMDRYEMFYDNDGNLLEEKCFCDDDPPFLDKLEWENTYKDGKIYTADYDWDGNLVERGEYIDIKFPSSKTGVNRFYDKEGNLVKTVIYKDGVVISEEKADKNE